MKKILSCLLTIILISTTICSIFATLPAEFKVSSVNANAGDTVNIDISIIGNPGIASIKLDVEYSTDLILNSIQYNTELGGQSQQPQTLTSPVTLNWINGAADTVGDMTYATLSFTVSATASAGDKPITVTYNPDDVYNTNLDNVPFAVTNGMITVSCSHLNTAQDAGKEPSCTETGFTSGVYCNDCEAWISGHEVIPTVAHDYEWVIDKNATEDETGLKHEECTKCHTKRNESTVIDKLPHSHAMTKVTTAASTCTNQGNNEYYICTKCNKAFKDVNGNIATTIDAEKLPLAAHDYEWVIDKNATEDETGLKHEECTKCHTKRNESTVIDKLPHSHAMTKVTAVASTCTNQGNNEYYICTKCNKAFKDVNGNIATTIDAEKLPLAAHDYEWVIDKNATEDETGLKHEECTKCHTKRNESTVIPALGTSEPDDKPEDKPDVNPGCGGPFFIVRLIVKFIKFIFRIH